MEYEPPSKASIASWQPAPQTANALTVDVEDYFQVAAFEKIIPFSDWDRFDSRVCQNTERLLDLFSEYQVSATFFVLGWVAKKHPALIRKIRACGHEIASHGYRHVRVNCQDPAAFREDIRLAKNLIEQAIGEGIRGYRASTFSIRPDTLWALEILIEEGFEYDSSIFPIPHDRYGIPTAPRYPFKLNTGSGTLVEFPISTIRLLGRNMPATGGGYFRLLPYGYVSKSIRELNQLEGPAGRFLRSSLGNRPRTAQTKGSGLDQPTATLHEY